MKIFSQLFPADPPPKQFPVRYGFIWLIKVHVEFNNTKHSRHTLHLMIISWQLSYNPLTGKYSGNHNVFFIITKMKPTSACTYMYTHNVNLHRCKKMFSWIEFYKLLKPVLNFYRCKYYVFTSLAPISFLRSLF